MIYTQHGTPVEVITPIFNDFYVRVRYEDGEERTVKVISLKADRGYGEIVQAGWEQARKLASQNYDVDIFKDTLTDGTVVILAKHPELPGCMAHGATRDQAIENLGEARIEYIYSLLEDGLQVPYPRFSATSTDVNQEYVGAELTNFLYTGRIEDTAPDGGE